MKFNNKIYNQYLPFGTLIKVNKNKKPLTKWDTKTKSDKYNNKSNYAIIPTINKDSENLLIIDIDTKHGGKGLESLERLSKDIGVNLSDYKTVTTPSGGIHIYVINKTIPTMKRNYKNYKDIEFISGAIKGYCLLGSNKGIVSKNTKGDTITAEYIYNDDLVCFEDGIITILNNHLNSIVDTKSDDTKSDDTKTYKNGMTKKDYEDLESKEDRLEKIDNCIQWLAPFSEDYFEWVEYGGHIKKAGGTLEQWVEFSRLAGSDKFDEKKTISKWKDLPTANGKGIGTLISSAMDEKLTHIDNLLSADKIDVDNLKKIFDEFPTINKTKQETLLYNCNKATKEKFDIIDESIYDNKINNDEIFTWADLFLKSAKDGSGDYISFDDCMNGDMVYKKQYKVLNRFISNIFRTDNNTFIYIDIDKNIYQTLDYTVLCKKGTMERIVRVLLKDELYNLTHKIEEISNNKATSIIDYNGLLDYLKFMPIYNIDNSITFNDNSINVNDERKTVTISKIKDYGLPIIDDSVTDDDKKAVIAQYNAHWDELVEPITRWLISSRYTKDLKAYNIAILAGTDFGKSFHFKILD